MERVAFGVCKVSWLLFKLDCPFGIIWNDIFMVDISLIFIWLFFLSYTLQTLSIFIRFKIIPLFRLDALFEIGNAESLSYSKQKCRRQQQWNFTKASSVEGKALILLSSPSLIFFRLKFPVFISVCFCAPSLVILLIYLHNE